MEFKEGDRVHVLRYAGEDVDFYGTLAEEKDCPEEYFTLLNCTEEDYEGNIIYKQNSGSFFGEGKEDYYVLAEYVEDTKKVNNTITIKTKKEMNLPQLIEWAWENPKQVERRTFKSDKRDSFGKNAEIYFTNCGHGFYTHRVTDKDTFTVETEEEITEDTEFDIIVLIEKDGCSATWGNSSINKLKDNSSKEFHAYIDGEFKLIWRDGRLVE